MERSFSPILRFEASGPIAGVDVREFLAACPSSTLPNDIPISILAKNTHPNIRRVVDSRKLVGEEGRALCNGLRTDEVGVNAAIDAGHANM